MNVADIEAVESREEVAEHIRRAKESGGDRFETRHRRKDGALMDVEVSVNYLENRFFGFVRDITERKQAEKERERLLHDLGERVKELDCLYGMARILETPGISQTEVFRKTVALIPLAWQYPEITCARISIGGREYKTANFRSTNWRQSADIMIEGRRAGSVEVYYLAEKPLLDEGPFLREERDLIEAIAERLTRITERREVEKRIDALSSIHAAISSTLDFNEIIARALRESVQSIGCESGALILRDDGSWLTKHFYKLDESKIGVRLSDEKAKHLAFVAKTRRFMVVEDCDADERVDSQLMRDLGIRSFLAVPLIVGEEVIGVLAFHYLSVLSRFTAAEIDFAGKVASSVSLAVENAGLYREQKRIADTLQEAFLAVPEEIDGIDFGHLYHGATEAARVGGDFFDLFEIEAEKVVMFIGDVSGKGLEAARMTAMIRNTINAYAYEEDSPAEILRKTNRSACRAFPAGSFATVFLGILDKKTGALEYCNAGHPPPIVRRAGAGLSFLVTGNGPVGIFEGFEFSDRLIKLKKDDLLFAYTDGLFEARGDGRFYGEKRLRKAVKESGAPASRLPQAVFNEVVGFTKGKLSDDIAILCVSL